MCKCFECVYLGLKNTDVFYCNCGDSEMYETEVTANNGCDAGETPEDE